MSEPFLGEIRLMGCSYAPEHWALCDGRLLQIVQFQALFSLLGTMYGGNGQTTFGIPDLRGRAAIGFGQGPGLMPYPQGQKGGAETVTLIANEVPAHSHPLMGTTTAANQTDPTGKALGGSGRTAIYSETEPDVQMNGHCVGASQGGGLPHGNMPPYQVLNYCIALTGIYPSRG